MGTCCSDMTVLCWPDRSTVITDGSRWVDAVLCGAIAVAVGNGEKESTMPLNVVVQGLSREAAAIESDILCNLSFVMRQIT
jgi:hypothetical protein